MALSLVAGTLALAQGLFTSFQGLGGTPPYTYVVMPGGAGGTIDAATGIYSAPIFTGIDIIQVNDSVGAYSQVSMLIGTPLQLFCDIIANQLGLSRDQVYLWDQKINIPIDDRLYVAVSILTCKPFGNSALPNGAGSGLDFVQSTNFMATLNVNILSRSTQARDRKEEVILALQSYYAQSQQEINGFYVAKLPTAFVNLSQEDGAAIPYRFIISVNVQYAFRKILPVPYFDTFTAPTVITEP